MDLFADLKLTEMVSTFIYVGIGLFCMFICWRVIEFLTPFSLEEEIREKNLAVAVLMGAVFIALSIVIAAVIVS